MGFLKYIAPRVFPDGINRANRLAMSLVETRPVQRLLDVGCGAGELTLEFARQLEAREVAGVEFIDSERQKAESRGIKCSKFDLNESWDVADNYFDVVLSSMNIEHMHNTRRYIEESLRCLKPGGQFLVISDNLASWVNIFALSMGWQPFSTTNMNGWSLGNPWIWHADQPKDAAEKNQLETGISGTAGHVRVLAFLGLKEILRKVGFERVEVYTRGYLPFAGRFSDVMCILDPRHGHFLVGTGFKPARHEKAE